MAKRTPRVPKRRLGNPGGKPKLTEDQWRVVKTWLDEIPHQGSTWPVGSGVVIRERIRKELGVSYSSAGLYIALRRQCGLSLHGPPLPGLDRRRKEILQAVQTHPGIHFREITRLVKPSPTTVANRLARLQNEGILEKRRTGRIIRYYPAGQVPVDWKRDLALKEPDLRQLHAWIARQASPPAQLVIVGHAEAEWGWGASTTKYRLGRLVKARLLKTKRQGHLLLYFPRRG